MLVSEAFSRVLRRSPRLFTLKGQIALQLGKPCYCTFVHVNRNSRRLQVLPELVVNQRKTSNNLAKSCLVMFFGTASNRDYVVEKERYLSLPLEEKRKVYRCGPSFVTLDKIPTWAEYATAHGLLPGSSNPFNEKVSLFEGDITSLEIDCIVNAANNKLMGGGGVDGAIHRSAGPELKAECATLGGCGTGDAKITGGYRLPAKYIIHTVGPIGEIAERLNSCYCTSLRVMQENNLKSIAFPCISTGVYGYPNEKAAHVAIEAVRRWIESNASQVDRIIFCLFLKEDIKIYHNLMPSYFPAH